MAAWLDARTPRMPDGLRRAVDAALERVSEPSRDRGADLAAGEPVALVQTLSGAALETLREVAHAPPARATAADLLAADALLTYAFEAAAEEGPDAVDRLTAELDYARFETLLESTRS